MMTYRTRTGRFLTVEVRNLNRALTFRPVYNVSDVTLVVVNIDVTNDGCADDRDLQRILIAFGTTGSLPEELDGDGDVDNDDLALLLSNFGGGCQ